ADPRRAAVRWSERRPKLPTSDGGGERNLSGLVPVLRGIRGLMPAELYIVCALPYSCATDTEFHVSLLVTPRLTPDVPFHELSSFSLFPHGGSLVKQHIAVELSDRDGPIEAKPLLGDVKPKVWDTAFPPETPVNGQEVPNWGQRRWRSFDARTVHDFGKA